MIRKQGRTALGSKTRSSPFRGEKDSNSPDSCPLLPTRPAITRHTAIALLGPHPPPLSWALPVPANVRMPPPLGQSQWKLTVSSMLPPVGQQQ